MLPIRPILSHSAHAFIRLKDELFRLKINAESKTVRSGSSLHPEGGKPSSLTEQQKRLNDMKRITYLFIWVGLYCLFMMACKHDIDPATPDSTTPDPTNPTPSTTEPGAVQPVGTPRGTAVIKTIGSAGGSISSEDGRFTVAIPAGALATDVAISMQPITNTNGTGKGDGYRMLPDGQKFAKPVTMTIKYSDEDLAQTIDEALGIAYQNVQGVWMAVGGVQLDKTQRGWLAKTRADRIPGGMGVAGRRQSAGHGYGSCLPGTGPDAEHESGTGHCQIEVARQRSGPVDRPDLRGAGGGFNSDRWG
jgi:hypothetical protein